MVFDAKWKREVNYIVVCGMAKIIAMGAPSSLGRKVILVIIAAGLALNQVYRLPRSSWETFSLDTPERCVDDAEEDILNRDASFIAEKGSSESENLFASPKRPSNCEAVVHRMNEWNDCWRRHLVQLKLRQPNSTKTVYQNNVVCPVMDEDGTTKMEIVGAPLYQWAFYKGQGFGRVVEHTVEACLAAFVLQRPCLINMAPRDPFYTWRSFIQAQSYQWDPSVLHSMPDYAEQIEKLAAELPNRGANEWKRPGFDAAKYDSDNSLIFPMQRKFDAKLWKSSIQFYHANNTSSSRRPKQVLFSPNWGEAWFTKWPMAQIFREQHNCNYGILKTKMQEALYEPTDLTRQLHQARYENATSSGTWIQSATRKGPPVKKTGLAGSNSKQEFGAIHLRMHFINAVREAKGLIEPGELTSMIRHCLKQASSSMEDGEFPQNWWLLADNTTMAVSTANELRARQQSQLEGADQKRPLNNKTVPIVNLYHNYVVTNPSNYKKLSSTHSSGDTARGKYGHVILAGAIEDWMTIHSSKVAIVVRNGSFGTTAARGNGKMPIDFCGGGGTQKRRHFQIFF